MTVVPLGTPFALYRGMNRSTTKGDEMTKQDRFMEYMSLSYSVKWMTSENFFYAKFMVPTDTLHDYIVLFGDTDVVINGRTNANEIELWVAWDHADVPERYRHHMRELT